MEEEDESLYSTLVCQEIIAEQNYEEWCGSDGPAIRATLIVGNATSCTFSVKYRDTEVPAYSGSIRLMSSPLTASSLFDNLPSTFYQKIADVTGLGDEASYYQADNADTSRAFVARSSNVLTTIVIDDNSNSGATCIAELEELKIFTKQLLLNL